MSVLGQVSVDGLEEALTPNVCDHLAEDRRTLRVRDAVEVDFDIFEVTNLSPDRVCRWLLVLSQPPFLASQETNPRIRPAGRFRSCKVSHELREGFIQPEVVPPLHGDQVAEPHVGKLVKDRVGPVFQLPFCWLRPENVLVAQGYAAGVLHGSGVVFGNENLVILRERVGNPVRVFEETKALFSNLYDLIRIQVLGQRRSAEDPQVDFTPVNRPDRRCLPHVRPSNNGCDVRGDTGRRGELEGRVGAFDLRHRGW